MAAQPSATNKALQMSTEVTGSAQNDGMEVIKAIQKHYSSEAAEEGAVTTKEATKEATNLGAQDGTKEPHVEQSTKQASSICRRAAQEEPTSNSKRGGEEYARHPSLVRATASTQSQPGAFAQAPSFLEGSDTPRDLDIESLLGSSTSSTGTQSSSANDSNLVVANIVEENMNLPRAVVESAESKSHPTKKQMVFVCFKSRASQASLCVAVPIALALILLITFLRPTQTSQADPFSDNNIHIANNTTKDHILTLLPDYTVQSVLLKESDNLPSPQASALEWILQDPHLETYLQLGDQHRRFLQRFALATFYYAMNGDYWHYNTHWLSYEYHECQWFARNAFAFDQPDDQVIYLRDYPTNKSHPCEWPNDIPNNDNPMLLSNDSNSNYYQHLWLHVNNLQGTIPREIFWLSSLRSISLYSNEGLHGSIPSQIGDLSDLEGIALAYSQLSGTVPTEIGNLKELYFFALLGNQFTGSIPSQIGLISDLDSIIFDDNLFTGTVPEEVYLHTQLRTLYLFGNRLTGTLSTSVGQLTNLWDWQLYDNQWSAQTIPTQIGLMTSLKRIILPRMNFTGSLCSELGLLTNRLLVVELEENHLEGRIPSELGLLSNTLEHLLLQDNKLSGEIPSELQCLDLWAWNVTGNPGLRSSEEDSCRLNMTRLEGVDGICELDTHLPVYCYCSQCSCPSLSDNVTNY